MGHIKTNVPSVKGDIGLELKREPGRFSMSLVSPSGTTALVGIPKDGGSVTAISANGQQVWKKGRAQSGPEGLTFKEETEGYIIFSAEPGTWNLTASLK